MGRKTILFLLLPILLFNCSDKPQEMVSFYPEEPVAGQIITIKFRPEQLTQQPEQRVSVIAVFQTFGTQGIRTNTEKMILEKDIWKTTIDTDKDEYLLSIKFEDNLDRTEDNNGSGWHISLKDQNGNVQKNTHYQIGRFANQKEGGKLSPNLSLAIREFKIELRNYPNNYNAWFELWQTRIRHSTNKAIEAKIIKSELDSLIGVKNSNPELYALAFNAYHKILNQNIEAINYGEKYLESGANLSEKDKIKHSLIILKYRNNPAKLINELNVFSNETNVSKLKKKSLYQLASIYQQLKMFELAIKTYEKYLQLETNNITVRLALANLYLKNQQFQKANEMIEEASVYNSQDNLILSEPWQKPFERNYQINLTQCQLLSTMASLNFATQKNQEAIANRKKCIKLDTPFPAFEWEKIGDTYSVIGKIDSAQLAYIKSISINQAQESAKLKLKKIYLDNNGNIHEFELFLKNSIKAELASSAQLAPNVQLTDVSEQKYRITDQKNKIIVLVFWDSFSKAFEKELPQLNKVFSKYRKNDKVLFWAASVETPLSIKKYNKENIFSFRQFHSSFDAKKAFNVIGFPTHFIIDGSGKIRYKHAGYTPEIENILTTEIQTLLDEANDIS